MNEKTGTIVSVAIVALAVLWLAYLVGTWKGEARAHADRDKADMKRRLFALEQARDTKTSERPVEM